LPISEASFQAALIKRYEREGWYVLRVIKASVAGIPDLVLMKPDQPPVFVEVKRDGGRLSPVQAYRHAELRSLGFQVETIAPSGLI